jgi:hypothetical protein
MLKLYNIYESLIVESVMRNAIIDVINKKQRVKITYSSDEDDEHTGERYIEVYTYGIAKNGGYEAIRAYQLSGDTNTVKPMWKFFKVDNILSWEPVKSFFKTSIEDRDSNHVDYREGRENKPIKVNHDGDKHMSVIHAQVSFDDEHVGSYQNRKAKEKAEKEKVELQKWRDDINQKVYKNHKADVEKRRQQQLDQEKEMQQRAQQMQQKQNQQMQQQNNDYEEEDIEDDEPNTPEHGRK